MHHRWILTLLFFLLYSNLGIAENTNQLTGEDQSFSLFLNQNDSEYRADLPLLVSGKNNSNKGYTIIVHD